MEKNFLRQLINQDDDEVVEDTELEEKEEGGEGDEGEDLNEEESVDGAETEE